MSGCLYPISLAVCILVFDMLYCCDNTELISLSHHLLIPMILEEDFDQLSAMQTPEMQRSDLAPVILQMKALGIVNVVRFDYISVHLSLSLITL